MSIDSRNQTVVAAVGQELAITLGNVGPAIYTDPIVSSTAVAYLGVSIVPPYTPAGPTQRFRFRATTPGVAVLTFRRMLDNAVVATVEDTVLVR